MSTEESWQSGAAQRVWTTSDAVVVVPGVMGSELYDTTTDRTIWGLRPGLAVKALLPGGEGLAPLAVDSVDERRVRATGLLRFPTYMFGLGSGIEPYAKLVRTLRQVVRHPDAVAPFPYDWRLPVAYNARRLADKVRQHLAFWRHRSGRPDAQVVLVAHSMGGLVCQAMFAISGTVDVVRAIITLGTPFDGAAKAAPMLANGEGRLHRMLRPVALTMPSIYDLLPGYRCVDTGDTVERLTVADVVALGGREDLASVAAGHRTERARIRLPRHRALIGVEQPTVSSLLLKDGTAAASLDTFDVHPDGELVRDRHGRLQRFPGRGDGTVPRNSALPLDSDPYVLAQQHTTLAQSDEAISFVRDVLVHGRADIRPRLGHGDVGVDLPDVVRPGVEWTGTLTGIDPFHIACTITDADTNTPVDHPQAHRRDGEVCIASVADRPGLFRIRIDGGSTPVVRFVLAVP